MSSKKMSDCIPAPPGPAGAAPPCKIVNKKVILVILN
jgi:hypothetical protein